MRTRYTVLPPTSTGDSIGGVWYRAASLEAKASAKARSAYAPTCTAKAGRYGAVLAGGGGPGFSATARGGGPLGGGWLPRAAVGRSFFSAAATKLPRHLVAED